MAEQAQQALLQERPLEAAALYEEAAKKAPSPQRDEWRIRAADIYAQLGNADMARRLASMADVAAVSPPLRYRLTLTRAQIDLLSDTPSLALARLREVPPDLEPPLERRWLKLKAQSLEDLEDYLESARLRDTLSERLTEPEAVKANRDALWHDLTRAPAERISALMPPAPTRFGAWLELAYIFHQYRLDLNKLDSQVQEWLQRYPDHPARDYVSRLLADYRERLQPPREIALMLPLSGRLAGIGQAIKHGFMTAYFEDHGERPRIRVFDVGDKGMDVVSAYRDAVEAGVDFVVGPLTKQSLEALSVWDTFPVPVLALNTVASADFPTDRFYQFGLAPEDDARAAADLMAAQGRDKAVVLVPNTDWGDRIAGAFRQAFEAAGHQVLDQAYYRPDASDFGDAITGLFNLDASRDRYHRLRRALHAHMEFQPRRRHDMDSVFFAAYPEQARLIRPQIRFHHGIGVPVYATSHAYAGYPQPGDDQDMDGLSFVEIPWLLGHVDALPDALQAQALGSLWPSERQRFPRLLALGIDAYRLAPIVDVLREFPQESVPEATGRIRVAQDGQIHRLLQAAQFKDGRAEPLDLPGAPFGGGSR